MLRQSNESGVPLRQSNQRYAQSVAVSHLSVLPPQYNPHNAEEIDTGKFKQYFSTFHKGITALEEEFHESKAKFSKSVSKLFELFQKPADKTKTFQTSHPMKTIEPSLSINKPRTAMHSQSSNSRVIPLNVIGEEEEESVRGEQLQKRSGTAEGRRKPNNFVI